MHAGIKTMFGGSLTAGRASKDPGSDTRRLPCQSSGDRPGDLCEAVGLPGHLRPKRLFPAKMSSPSTGGTEGSSPASSPASGTSLAMAAPKFGTLVPNRIFVGGISANTSEAELSQLFSAYGNVKATKIIADRAGVSKGYGFVTFETEEEAKRLQQESECIVLKERKLNIAPAIKKQPFNRSFDNGSGSPPTVPTNTLYYANGMGLAYQNGMTFYNTAAPTPGTPVAPTTDPTTIYQAAAGVFGPQATVGHQAFAPMMYPCPAPSLYMPQQYQYSPMPYEPYFTGTTSASGSPYIFATGTSHSTSSGTGSGSSGNNTASNSSSSLGAGHPPSITLPAPPPQHFYTPPQQNHHPVASAPATQDHLYYSIATAPPLSHQSHALGLTSDQQLLFYPTDVTCQQHNSSDSQATQEDTHSTSSHSEQPHSESQPGHQGGTGGTPLVPLMPVKYPFNPSQYAGYQMGVPSVHTNGLADSDEVANQLQPCRAIMYPTALFIHPGSTQYGTTGAGASLLPTPPTHLQFDPSKLPSPGQKSNYYNAKRFSGLATKSHNSSPKFGAGTPATSYSGSSSTRLSNYSYGRRSAGSFGSSVSTWFAGPKSNYNPQKYNSSYSHSNYLRQSARNGDFSKRPSDNEESSTPVDDGQKLTGKPTSPPTPAYSSTPCPMPILSPNPPPQSQVQYYPSVQNRIFAASRHNSQQQRIRAPPIAQTIYTPRKQPEKHGLRQTKHKTNGKINEETDNRLPITPPGTPATEQTQLNEACHNLQALGL